MLILVLTLTSCKTTRLVKFETPNSEKFIISDKDTSNGYCFYQIEKTNYKSYPIMRVAVDKECLYKKGDTLTNDQINHMKH